MACLVCGRSPGAEAAGAGGHDRDQRGEEAWKHQAEELQASAAFHASGGRLVRLEFPHTEVQRFGGVAVTWSTYRLEIDVKGKRAVDAGRATEIFVLRDGQWVNSGWHTDSGK